MRVLLLSFSFYYSNFIIMVIFVGFSIWTILTKWFNLEAFKQTQLVVYTTTILLEIHLDQAILLGQQQPNPSPSGDEAPNHEHWQLLSDSPTGRRPVRCAPPTSPASSAHMLIQVVPIETVPVILTSLALTLGAHWLLCRSCWGEMRAWVATWSLTPQVHRQTLLPAC